jgi:hypothetical protein
MRKIRKWRPCWGSIIKKGWEKEKEHNVNQGR